jgi:beta-aspartyl-peptidase (threonine type)
MLARMACPTLSIHRAVLLAAAFACCAVSQSRATNLQSWLTGNAADAKPERTEAALLLMGGGGDVDEAFKWFVQKAGGGDIVILRASGSDGYNDYLFRKIGGVDSVETFLCHNRDASKDPQLLAALRNAEGIWLAGGDQSRYVNYWKGTPVAEALNAHVRGNKPLGGTSAGLAVLGEYSFSATEQGALTSAIALADPFDRRITLERDFLSFELLRGVITDSHFTPRARLGRALAFLARLMNDEPRRDRLVGLGIDEKTALAVESGGLARVFTTAPNGCAWLMLPTRPAEQLTAGRPLTFRNVRVIALGPESQLDLARLVVLKPHSASLVSVVDGKLSQ